MHARETEVTVSPNHLLIDDDEDDNDEHSNDRSCYHTLLVHPVSSESHDNSASERAYRRIICLSVPDALSIDPSAVRSYRPQVSSQAIR